MSDERKEAPVTGSSGVGTSSLMQRLSQEFISAQNSMDRTVLELRTKMRSIHQKLDVVLNELENNGVSAGVERLSGIGEEGLAVERLSRLLRDQRNDIEDGIDNVRACSRRS